MAHASYTPERLFELGRENYEKLVSCCRQLEGGGLWSQAQKVMKKSSTQVLDLYVQSVLLGLAVYCDQIVEEQRQYMLAVTDTNPLEIPTKGGIGDDVIGLGKKTEQMPPILIQLCGLYDNQGSENMAAHFLDSMVNILLCMAYLNKDTDDKSKKYMKDYYDRVSMFVQLPGQRDAADNRYILHKLDQGRITCEVHWLLEREETESITEEMPASDQKRTETVPKENIPRQKITKDKITKKKPQNRKKGKTEKKDEDQAEKEQKLTAPKRQEKPAKDSAQKAQDPKQQDKLIKEQEKKVQEQERLVKEAEKKAQEQERLAKEAEKKAQEQEKLAKEAEQKALEEAKRKEQEVEAEKQRLKEEKQRLEEEKQRLEDEKKRQEEEKKLREEEKKRREETRKRFLEAQKRHEEEEKARKEQEARQAREEFQKVKSRLKEREKAEREEQEKRIAVLLGELNELVGLESVKEEIRSLINLIKVRKLRDKLQIPAMDMSYHMVFTGSPGTGKTTVARLVAKIYKELGILSEGQLVETDRSRLVAGYVGQTAINVREIVEQAVGGVLFIDEAYALVSPDTANDFGSEAVDTLVKLMEDNRDNLVVIVAGYTEEMKVFLRSNTGLISRFNKFIAFQDYTQEQLLEILQVMVQQAELQIEPEAVEQIGEKLASMGKQEKTDFGNARGVRNIFEKMVMNQANRLVMVEEPTREQLVTLTREDAEQLQL